MSKHGLELLAYQSSIGEKLVDRDENGEYDSLPHQSPTTAFPKTVAFAACCQDTTYAGHDVSMLEPISEYNGRGFQFNSPWAPRGECKPFQEVLIEMEQSYLKRSFLY